MKQHIPLTLNLITKQNEYRNFNTYLFANYIYHTLDYIDVDLDKGKYKDKTVVAYLNDFTINDVVAQAHTTRASWYRGGGSDFPQGKWISNNEMSIAFLPFRVFEKVMRFLEPMHPKSREPIFRLYCYIYFQDSFYYHQFQRPQYEMAAELGIDVVDINCNLQKLIDAGLILRSGKYKFAGEKTFAYYHSIPVEDRYKKDKFQIQQFSCLFSVYDI